MPNCLDCGMPGAVTGVSIDVAPAPASVPLCVGTLISQSRHEPLPSKTAKSRGQRKARTVLDRPPPLQGWRTTDEDEIALRRWRGRTEIVAIEALEPEQPFFGTFRVQSGSGGFYEVEIRTSMASAIPAAASIIASMASAPASTSRACSRLCAGAAPRRSARPLPQGSPRIEVFLDRRGAATPTLTVARRGNRRCERGAPLARSIH